MSRFKKRVFIAIVILLAACAMMLFFNRHKGLDEQLKIVSYPYDVLSKALSSASSKVSDLFGTAEENRRLREELLAAETERQRYGEVMAENRRLTELLQLKGRIDPGGRAVRVVGRGYNRMSSTLIVDKGGSQGIVMDMPVVTSRGLAGKVVAVRGRFSDILLLNDLNFSAAVRFRDSRREGVVTGSGRGYCILKYVPVEEQVKTGDVVVTSGLDGVFPAGIPVGAVTKVRTEGVEFFQYIEIEPFQDPDSIEEAMVISRSATLKDMTQEPVQEAETPAAATQGE
jgi:rod shape-determining protein MreC